MSRDPILCQVEDGVAIVTLNNPPLNLVTLGLTRELERTLDRLATDPEARVLVLTGAGERAFCAGSDISEFPGVADDVVGKKLAPENRAYSKVDDFPKPTIAAVAGLAYGGGLELAVCCDLIVVEEHARLALPEIKLGVFPGSGGTVRVTRRIGEGRAKELMYFGEPIDAQTALAWGLINRVVLAGPGADHRLPHGRGAGRAAGQGAPALQARDRSFLRRERGSGDRALARAVHRSVPVRRLQGGRARVLREAPAAFHPQLRRATPPATALRASSIGGSDIMHVAVIDIGKPGKNLGWAMTGPMASRGTDLDECVGVLAAALGAGPLALGFEAPMFVPARRDPAKLLSARCGEGNRPFSAGAGATVLVLGITSQHSIVVRGLDQHIQWTGAESLRMIIGLRPANF